MNAPRTQTTTTVTHEDEDARIDGLLAQVQAKGRDTRDLTPDDRATMLASLCRRLGLNPLSNAVCFLLTNGKETLYVTKQGADQIAVANKLTRETIAGPHVITIEGVKVVFCQVRATHPDGRSEVSTAALPFSASNIVNDLMKCESKAKRRATLSLCGLGLLAEDEIETIAGAIVPPAPSNDAESPPAEMHPALEAFYASVAELELPGEGVAVWLKHKAAVAAVSSQALDAAWKAVCARVEVVGKMKNAKVWLKKACAEELARRETSGKSDHQAA